MALKSTYSTQEIVTALPVTRQALEKRIKREQGKGRWIAEKRKGRGGGFVWKFDSIPQDIQLAIRIAEERQILAAENALLSPQAVTENAISRAVENAILDDKRRYKALAKADLLGLYLDWQKKHGSTVKSKDEFILAYKGGAWPKLLKELGPRSWKALEKWKLQQAKGNIYSLVDKRGIAHKGRSTLSAQHRVIILGQVLNPNAPDISACARRVQKRCKAEGLHEPSEATIRRFVKTYMSECYDEYVLWREGQKAWNDKCAISLLRDWNLVEVGDIVIADGHTLNFETIDPDTGKAKRMTLLLFYDGASNHPLGWEIMATENVACISSAFRRTCLLLGKYPKVVYLDNGKAFRAKFFKGTADFREAGFLGLYRDLGCEVIHAWPYHGQSKPVERFFGTMHELEAFVPSYTGNSIAAKPPRMKRGEDLHRRLYDSLGGRPLTLEETHTEIARWFCEYAQRPQYRTHLAGRAPAEVFNAGRGEGVDMQRLTLLMLQKVVKTISKDGIRHMGRLYWHEALSSRRHSVLVRYDDQLSPYSVLVYDMAGNFICEARDRDHYKIASGLHPAARALGTPEQVQALSEAIDLKRGQEKRAGTDMRAMLEAVVRPEMEQRTKAIAAAPKPAKIITYVPKAVSQEEIAEVEAAKERARVNSDTNLPRENEYTPSAMMRFADEMQRYEYLFKLVHEQGVALIPQDQVWKDAFEQTPVFQRNLKRRYEQILQLHEFREQQVS